MVDASTAPSSTIDALVQNYGDLLFDFCSSILWSQSGAQTAVRIILKDLEKRISTQTFGTFERTFVLQVTCDKLKKLVTRLGRHLSASEQIMLDATLDAPGRLKYFDSYFHRLNVEDQMLLLMRNKYELTYAEIADVLQTPQGSLRIKHQQAIRALEEWLWDQI